MGAHTGNYMALPGYIFLDNRRANHPTSASYIANSNSYRLHIEDKKKEF